MLKASIPAQTLQQYTPPYPSHPQKAKKENEEKGKKKIDKYSETMLSCSSETLNIGQRQPSVLSKPVFLSKNFSVGLQNTAHLFFRWMSSRTQLSLTSTIASILHNRKLACWRCILLFTKTETYKRWGWMLLQGPFCFRWLASNEHQKLPWR